MEFAFVLFLFPIAVLVASVVGTVLTKRWFVMPIVTLVLFIALTVTVFNESFWIWVGVYTVLAVVGSVVTRVLVRK